MIYLSDFFKHSWDFCRLVLNTSNFIIWLSVCYLTLPFRKYVNYVWMRYLSEMFWRCSRDISTQNPNNYRYFVCLLVWYLSYFLTEMRQILGYLQFWMLYLTDIFADIPGLLVHLFRKILNFLYVCQYVCWFTYLQKFCLYRNIFSSGWHIAL